jgi:hypothetical protein
MDEYLPIPRSFSSASHIYKEARSYLEPRSFYDRFTYGVLVNPSIPPRWLVVIKVTLGIFAVLLSLGTAGIGLLLIMKIEKMRLRFQNVVDKITQFYRHLEDVINEGIIAINHGHDLKVFDPALRMIKELTANGKMDVAIRAAGSLPAVPFTQTPLLTLLSHKEVTNLRKDVLYDIAIQIIWANGIDTADEVLSYIFSGDTLHYHQYRFFLDCGDLPAATERASRILDPEIKLNLQSMSKMVG